MMSDSHSDALIFFGATGDLAHKKIFPSLQAMLKRGHLEVPVIRVAKSGWNLDHMRLQVSPEVTIFLGMTRPSTNISRAPGVPARSIGGSPRRTAGITRP
jgi:glucose-6-phosphate 1-dehydrogenase